MSQVWSAQQRFFRSLCISAKLGRCAEMVEVALRSGKCVVIGLQSTGESQLRDELEDGGNIDQDQLSSATKHILESLVRKHFPTGSGFSSFVRDNSPSPSPSPPPPKRKKYESEESSSDSEDSGSSSDENPFLASDDEDPWLREKKSKKKKKIPKVSSFSNGKKKAIFIEYLQDIHIHNHPTLNLLSILTFQEILMKKKKQKIGL